MLLGKCQRPRHTMKRTTSMAGIIPVPVATAAEVKPTDDLEMNSVLDLEQEVGHGPEFANLGMVLPRNNYGGGAPSSGGGSSGGYDSNAPAAHFLETCGLCKRRLFPGRDIYMYRGDTAFCSLECREKIMKQDERKSRHNPNPCSWNPSGIDRMN